MAAFWFRLNPSTAAAQMCSRMNRLMSLNVLANFGGAATFCSVAVAGGEKSTLVVDLVESLNQRMDAQ